MRLGGAPCSGDARHWDGAEARAHVVIAGTLNGAAFTQDWSFTTCTECR